MTTRAGSLIRSALPYDILLTVLTLGQEGKLRGKLLAPARLRSGEAVLDFGVNPGAKRGVIGHLHRHGGLSAQHLSELAAAAGFRVLKSGPLGTWDLQYVIGAANEG